MSKLVLEELLPRWVFLLHFVLHCFLANIGERAGLLGHSSGRQTPGCIPYDTRVVSGECTVSGFLYAQL